MLSSDREEVPSFPVGNRVVVCLDASCDGGEAPHVDAEQGAEGRITAYTSGSDHPYFVLFRGRPVRAVVAGLPKTVLGRHYTRDELQALDSLDAD